MPSAHRPSCAVAILLGAALVLQPCAAIAEAPPATVAGSANWGDFLPAEGMRARSFVRSHPQLDGRGLAVAVLDTGVDPLAAGLQRTTDGQRKVIEARDFSGQGDVPLEPATVRGQVLLLADGHTATVAGLPASVDGHWWAGQLRETQIGPAELQDLNHDGKRDSVLALVVWRTGLGPGDVRATVDWDGDGDLAESPSVRPFHAAGELLVAPPRHADRDAIRLSLAFEADWPRQRAQLHFTDGSHGTHVAGIIAGHQMFGQAGWDGVAPGAQVLSLKIGHNGRSGGATPTGAFAQALQFAGEWTRRTGRPLVVNASYGVPAATEGRADLDREVDRLIQQYPLLTIAFSAGNAGPGLSSLGSPAAADLALAVGAVLPRDAAPALYGGKLGQDELFAFSSRGGELAKPEIVAPGAASASVPVWDGGEIKQGTSMAAPHAAGAMLLVWAALLQEAGGRRLDDLGWHSGLVRQALVLSAKPLTGYSAVEQGRGMVDVVAAAALAKRLAQRPQTRAALGFHFASQAPRGDGEAMPATFLRAGWMAEGPAVIPVDVHAWLPAAWSADRKLQWSAAFDLQASADWLEVTRPRVVLRSDRPATWEIRLRPERLQQPGVYVAHVHGREPGARDDELAFSHQVTVVVPHQLGAADQYRRSWPAVQLAAGKVWRQFIAVPPGTQQLRVALKRRDGQFAKAALAVFDPDGHRIRPAKRWVSSGEGSDAEWLASGKELTAGVWEVTAAAAVAPGDASRFDAEVDCALVHSIGSLDLSSDSGGRASGTVTLTQLGPQPLVGVISGRLDALERSKSIAADGDRVTHGIVLGPHVQGATLRLTVDRAIYDACTDIAVTVRDSHGQSVAESAFNSPTAEVNWSRKGGGDHRYTLEVTAGFAHPRKAPWSLTVHEKLTLEHPVNLQAKHKDGKTTRLYPFTPTAVTIQATEPLPQVPHGWRVTGEVHWHSEDGRVRRLTLPARGAE